MQPQNRISSTPIWLPALGSAVLVLMLFFGLVALFTGEWMIGFVDLGIVGLVVEAKRRK